MSSLLELWRRLPVILRAVLAGLCVRFAGEIPWTFLLLHCAGDVVLFMAGRRIGAALAARPLVWTPRMDVWSWICLGGSWRWVPAQFWRSGHSGRVRDFLRPRRLRNTLRVGCPS